MKQRFAAWALTALVAVTLMVYLIQPGEDLLVMVGNGSQTLAGLLAAIFLFRAASAFSKTDEVRSLWVWLAIGFGFNALGFATYAWYELIQGVEVPSPSLADLFWIAAYPAQLYGAFALLRRYVNAGFGLQVSKVTWGVVAAAMALVTYFLVVPTIAGEGDWLEKAVVLAYPLLDVVLFGCSVAIVLTMRQFGAGKLGAPWQFIALGMITVTAADMIYTYLSMQDLYQTGNLVDLGWILQGALVAWGGILQYHLVRGDGAGEQVA